MNWLLSYLKYFDELVREVSITESSSLFAISYLKYSDELVGEVSITESSSAYFKYSDELVTILPQIL